MFRMTILSVLQNYQYGNNVPLSRGDAFMLDAADYPNRTLGRRVLAQSDAVDRQVVAVNLAEAPLAWLARRGHLTGLQLAAAERLRTDHGLSGLGARVTMRWDPAPAGRNERGSHGAQSQSLRALDAKKRFDAAISAVGPGLSDVLWRVACEGEGLADAELALGWPTRAAKLVLGLALDRLVTHYENQYGKITIDNRDDPV
jgi:hypothetical protein